MVKAFHFRAGISYYRSAVRGTHQYTGDRKWRSSGTIKHIGYSRRIFGIVAEKSWGWLLLIIATLLHISSSVILILTLVVWINRRLLYILTSVCLLGYTVLSYGAVFILNAMGNPAAAQLWGK